MNIKLSDMDYRGLTVGDWLLDKIEGLPRRVVQVTSDVFGGCAPGVILENGMDYQECEPIPLTAEILEKNGFKRHNRYQYIYKDNYCKVCVSIAPRIEIDGMDLGEPPINVSIEGALFDINMSMSAIHELQHALRLCGLMDLADNFKVDDI